MPLMNGSIRLIAAPLISPQTVGGRYRTTGEPKEGGDPERSSAPEYCSLSEGTVTPDSVIGFVGSSEAIVPRSSAQICSLYGSKMKNCGDTEAEGAQG